MTRRKIALALAFCAGCALAAPPVQWDTSVLFEAPQTYSAEDYVPGGASNGVNAVFLEGLPFKGNATRVFAYWGVPANASDSAKVPGMVLVHWLCGTNDENFSLPSVERSFDLVPQAKSLALRVRLAHSHSAVSEQAPEVLATADSLLGAGPARPALAKPAFDGDSVSAAVAADAGLPVVSASLDYTTDDCAIWYSNVWKSASATYGDGKVTADVPAGAKYFYLNVDTESAGRVSSRIMTAADLYAKGVVPTVRSTGLKL